jgi:hypothetical protein
VNVLQSPLSAYRSFNPNAFAIERSKTVLHAPVSTIQYVRRPLITVWAMVWLEVKGRVPRQSGAALAQAEGSGKVREPLLSIRVGSLNYSWSPIPSQTSSTSLAMKFDLLIFPPCSWGSSPSRFPGSSIRVSAPSCSGGTGAG